MRQLCDTEKDVSHKTNKSVWKLPSSFQEVSRVPTSAGMRSQLSDKWSAKQVWIATEIGIINFFPSEWFRKKYLEEISKQTNKQKKDSKNFSNNIEVCHW